MPEQKYTTAEEVKARLKRNADRPVRLPATHQPHLRLRQVEVFREAAKRPNFAVTARELGVTPGTISQAIADLEHSLGGGVQLFDRSTAGATLTPAGKALVEKATQLLDDEASVKDAVIGAEEQQGDHQPFSEQHRPRLNLRHIEIFLEAAKHSSFATAARQLGVSPGAVSQAIVGLEQDLGEGGKLFDRSTAGASLTRAGKLLVARGRHLLNDESAVRDAVADVRSSEQGTERDAFISPLHRSGAENALAAVEFIEQNASLRREVKFPSALTRELEKTLAELGAADGTVERAALILDLMQASVSDDDDLSAMLEPGGRASERFRELYAVAAERFTQSSVRLETGETADSRPQRPRAR